MDVSFSSANDLLQRTGSRPLFDLHLSSLPLCLVFFALNILERFEDSRKPGFLDLGLGSSIRRSLQHSHIEEQHDFLAIVRVALASEQYAKSGYVLEKRDSR